MASELTPQQRILLNNLFDTQPKRREAYLKKLGFEMNPKDENEYRPIGSEKDLPYSEVDPGYIDQFKKGGLSAVLKEAGLDIADIGSDVAGGALQTAAAAQGVAGGTLLGAATGPAAPVAIPAMAAAGFVLGGSAGNAVAEEAKAKLGDLLLDGSVPIDRELQVMQSVFSGMLPAVFKGERTAIQAGIKKALNGKTEAIKNVAGKLGLEEGILKQVSENPDKFTKEAVENSIGKVKDGIYDKLFGLNSTQVKRPDDVSGIFADKMKILNGQADEIVSASTETIPVATLLEGIDKNMQRLASKGTEFSRSTDDQAAYKYFQQMKKDIMAEAKELGPDMDLKRARSWVGKVQDDAYSEEVKGANVLKSFSGGDPDGMKNQVYSLFGESGAKLREINGQRSKIFNLYNQAQSQITPSLIVNSTIGKDTIAKQGMSNLVGEIDSTLGTQFKSAIESGQAQAFVENAFKAEKPTGSSIFNSEVLKGALEGAAKGAGVGAATGIPISTTSIVGGGIGAYKATGLNSPKKAIEALTENVKLASSFNDVAGGALETIPGRAALQTLSSDLRNPQVQSTQPPVANEFDAIFSEPAAAQAPQGPNEFDEIFK